MNDMSDGLHPLGEPGERAEFLKKLGNEIEALLLRLEASQGDLIAYIDNRVAFLNTIDRSELSDEAKALLLESDYSVIQEVMKHRDSTAVRWICIWII